MKIKQNIVEMIDYQPSINDFRMEVLDGLKSTPKRLNSKLLYDEKGSALFEKITMVPEYYPTRTELAILTRYAEEISTYLGRQIVLIELGSGSSKKVKILLNAMSDPVAYMPIDISKEFLQVSTQSLANAYPHLQVMAICADYTQSFNLPDVPTKRVVFFPGSTFGNFEPQEAETFLIRLSRLLRKGDGLLIGIDLEKSASILNAAYNDTAGITAAFNLNLLLRMNRELHTNFQIKQFEHDAFYNEQQKRIEMHLKSLSEQVVIVDQEHIQFMEGETIHTENSYKFSIDAFQQLAEKAGFEPIKVWTDAQSLFSVHYLEVS